MESKTFPIGIQSFREIREHGLYYVDKTGYANLLSREGKHYFLSRPRRFGKSLFVSMLKELFKGNRKLFEGLAIYDVWDWSTSYPVIRLDFNGDDFSNPEHLEEHTSDLIEEAEEEYGIDPPAASHRASRRLSRLIRELYKKTNKQVVVLVDEYDKPILDTLHIRDVAKLNQRYLRGLYSNIKLREDEIRFSFLTGVGRFSRVSWFSGLNNLKDITLIPEFSEICGYTESDIDSVFASELQGLDREKIREWYNGYNWLGEEKVYNPYDILYLLEQRAFEPWWFESGSSEFLVETLKRHDVMSVNLDQMQARGSLLGSFDIDNVAPETLLFQSGYLTIVETARIAERTSYKLDYPNREVRQCLNELLLEVMLPGSFNGLLDQGDHLGSLLRKFDVKGMKELFQSVFASIPYQWHTPANIAKYEAYVASTFYSFFMGAGLSVRAEEFTNRGRIDLVVTGPSYVYLFEFKMVEKEASGDALEQIRDRDYAQKYRGFGKPVYLVGVEFSRTERNIVGFDVARDRKTDQ